MNVTTAPILVSKCNRGRWNGALCQQRVQTELKNDVICSGFTEVLVRSDKETAVLSLKESAATALTLAGATVKTEESAL